MKKLALSLCAVLIGASFAFGNLLTNPGWEDGKTSWTSWGASDSEGGEWWGNSPHGGTNLLGHWWQSGTYQDVAVSSASSYTYSAWVLVPAGDPNWGDARGEVKWEWRDQTVGDSLVGESLLSFGIASTATGVTFDVDVTGDTWTQVQLTGLQAPSAVTATHGRVIISSWNSGDPDGGGSVVFDDLDVTASAIPEPAAAALMLLGLGGIYAIRRRRRS